MYCSSGLMSTPQWIEWTLVGSTAGALPSLTQSADLMSCRVHRSLIKESTLYTSATIPDFIMHIKCTSIYVKLSLLDTHKELLFLWSEDILFFYFASALFNCEISKIWFLLNFLRKRKLLSNYWVAIWKFVFTSLKVVNSVPHWAHGEDKDSMCHPVIYHVREHNWPVASCGNRLHLFV